MGAGAFQQVRGSAEGPHHGGEALRRTAASDRGLDPTHTLLRVGTRPPSRNASPPSAPTTACTRGSKRAPLRIVRA